MKKYVQGDVSTIISQTHASYTSDGVEKVHSSGRKIKNKRLVGDYLENTNLKRGKSRSSVSSRKHFCPKPLAMTNANGLSSEERDKCYTCASQNIEEKTCDSTQYSDKSDFTIFVGNLPLAYDHKKVVKLFRKFGEVENARIRCVPVANTRIQKKTSAIIKKFHPNRNSAVAYVVFKKKESVFKAINENGMMLNGHHLRIDSANPQKRDLKKSVFVGGLPFDVKDDELWDLFKDCGEIENVRVIRDKNVSMGKGFGYVNFKSSASVELALKLNGREIKSRKINVERCIRKKKKIDSKSSSLFECHKKKQNTKSQVMVNKIKSKKRALINDFQGRIGERKSKKQRKDLTKDAVRKSRIKAVFLSSLSTEHKGKV